MNHIGKWEVSAVLSFMDGEMKWVTREEANNIEDFDLSMFGAVMEFTPDGTVLDMMKIPQGMTQDEINKAISEGAELVGDFFVTGKHEWKEEDGKLLYNTQVTGEVLGEELSPWVEIPENENGKITLLDMLRMKRM